jgi:hypothetical protein
MRTVNLSVIILSIIFFFAATILSTNYAQEKKSVDVKAKKVETSRGENPNIKFSVPKTDDNPEAKPEKERGAYCGIDFKNYTGYYIDIYVNGYYKGTLGPWADGSVTVYSGYTTIYCITTGGTLEWSDAGGCDYYFTYKLYAP